jgi:hypothetical protein
MGNSPTFSNSDLTDNLLFLDFAITKKPVALSEKNSQNFIDRTHQLLVH